MVATEREAQAEQVNYDNSTCLCFEREHVSCQEPILLIFWKVDTGGTDLVQDEPQDSKKEISEEIDTEHQQEEIDNPYLHYGSECICTPHRINCSASTRPAITMG